MEDIYYGILSLADIPFHTFCESGIRKEWKNQMMVMRTRMIERKSEGVREGETFLARHHRLKPEESGNLEPDSEQLVQVWMGESGDGGVGDVFGSLLSVDV